MTERTKANPKSRLLFAQISDIHIGFESRNSNEPNQHRLDAVVALLAAMDPAPAFLLVTGDLVENGSVEDYQRFRTSLQSLPFPAYFCLGNHDNRASFAQVFPDAPMYDSFVQYAFDAETLRVVVVDTKGDQRHGGEFDAARAAWLDRQLTASPLPAVVALHHPPTPSGIDWLTADPREPWVQRLHAVITNHSDKVVAIIAGHYHRPMMAIWANTTVFVCPPVASQVALDLRTIDVECPDDRAMIVDEPPGFALHSWADGVLTSHIGVVGSFPVLARYNERSQALVRMLVAERENSVAGAKGAALEATP